jgi:hypothetical protein
MFNSVLLHKLIIIAIILIPFYPLIVLKYAVYIPLLLSLSWIVMGGCVLTHAHNKKNNSKGGFIYNIFKEYFPTITESRVTEMINFSLILITVISFHRLYVK